MRDDYLIRCAERTGFSPWVRSNPVCPICGEECEVIYRDRDGDIVGCDECVQTLDACEVLT